MFQVEYETVVLAPYDEDQEHAMLLEMGEECWILACSSVFNNNGSGSFSAKYYFYRKS